MTCEPAEFPRALSWRFWPSRNNPRKTAARHLPYRLSVAADRDVDGILWETARRFGPLQRQRYAELINAAIGLVAVAPERPGSRPRDEIGNGARSFHIERATARRGAAAHLLFYRVERQPPDGSADILILRVLHERMDPTRHIADQS